MKVRAALLIVGLMLASQVFADNKPKCRCIAPEPSETTHQGGNEKVTFMDDKTYKSVHGVVLNENAKGMEGVLVEILDNPEWIVLRYPKSRVEQRRVAACKRVPTAASALKTFLRASMNYAPAKTRAGILLTFT
jgi:hypothetical protein